MVQREFSPGVGCLQQVRRFVELATSPESLGLVIVTVELADHVLRHATSPFTVSLVGRAPGRLELSDGDSILPAVQDLLHDEAGLGFTIIQGLVAQWGLTTTRTGRSVWAVLAV